MGTSLRTGRRVARHPASSPKHVLHETRTHADLAWSAGRSWFDCRRFSGTLGRRVHGGAVVLHHCRCYVRLPPVRRLAAGFEGAKGNRRLAPVPRIGPRGAGLPVVTLEHGFVKEEFRPGRRVGIRSKPGLGWLLAVQGGLSTRLQRFARQRGRTATP